MSKSVDKGTRHENHVRDTYLRRIWASAERAAKSGVHDYGDFINVGDWLIEAKWRKKIRGEVWNWINTVVSKVRWRQANFRMERTPPWAIFFAQDRRSAPGIDLVVMDAADFTNLLRLVRDLGAEIEALEDEPNRRND